MGAEIYVIKMIMIMETSVIEDYLYQSMILQTDNLVIENS